MPAGKPMLEGDVLRNADLARRGSWAPMGRNLLPL